MGKFFPTANLACQVVGTLIVKKDWFRMVIPLSFENEGEESGK
jgi:hypothetical protein